MYRFVCLVISAIFSVLVSSFALPQACSGVCTNSHDPSLIRRDDGTYFRFSTGGRVAIHTAPNISGPWSYIGAALPRGSSINLRGNQDLWVGLAPKAKHHLTES